MKQFRATVRVSGMLISTIVFADNAVLAYKLVQAQYGAANVIAIPNQVH